MEIFEKAFTKEVNCFLGKKSITSTVPLTSVLNHREMFYFYQYIKHKYNYLVDYSHDKTIKEIIQKITKEV